MSAQDLVALAQAQASAQAALSEATAKAEEYEGVAVATARRAKAKRQLATEAAQALELAKANFERAAGSLGTQAPAKAR